MAIKQTIETRAYETIRLAQINAERTDKPMKSSAVLALADAEVLFEEGSFANAHARALTSLRYSVGILHPDYAAASEFR